MILILYKIESTGLSSVTQLLPLKLQRRTEISLMVSAGLRFRAEPAFAQARCFASHDIGCGCESIPVLDIVLASTVILTVDVPKRGTLIAPSIHYPVSVAAGQTSSVFVLDFAINSLSLANTLLQVVSGCTPHANLAVFLALQAIFLADDALLLGSIKGRPELVTFQALQAFFLFNIRQDAILHHNVILCKRDALFVVFGQDVFWLAAQALNVVAVLAKLRARDTELA